jgi:hypothetical protein
MAKNRNDDLVSIFDTPLDETVAGILNNENRRREEMQISSEERRRLVEQRRKEADRKQVAREKARQCNRMMLDLPPDLMTRIEAMARWQGVTSSQVVTYLLYEAATHYDKGSIRFEMHKYPSYNPRYDFELIHPQDTERQNRRSAKKKKSGWG